MPSDARNITQLNTTMKKGATLVLIMLAVTMLTSFDHLSRLKPSNISEKDWTDSIAIALETNGLFMIDGDIYIADSVPCYSSGTQRHGLFGRLVQGSYIDCSSCEMIRGVPNSSGSGFCTKVRKYQPK